MGAHAAEVCGEDGLREAQIRAVEEAAVHHGPWRNAPK